jgi:predicted Zn-dependent protease
MRRDQQTYYEQYAAAEQKLTTLIANLEKIHFLKMCETVVDIMKDQHQLAETQSAVTKSVQDQTVKISAQLNKSSEVLASEMKEQARAINELNLNKRGTIGVIDDRVRLLHLEK